MLHGKASRPVSASGRLPPLPTAKPLTPPPPPQVTIAASATEPAAAPAPATQAPHVRTKTRKFRLTDAHPRDLGSI
ncbi:hypothetical protein HDU88_000797 [Geranomyces variabilis]|nr:hypothetical protein HDU88_000797 [Geranomyces variabilis]